MRWANGETDLTVRVYPRPRRQPGTGPLALGSVPDVRSIGPPQL